MRRQAPPDRVAIIGAGVAGLAAAIDLSARSVPVTVFERAASPGGKMRTQTVGGATVDAGPTVLTYREGFEALFSDAGANLHDHVTLTPARILARHAWDEASQFDLYADSSLATQAVGALSGARQARLFERFLSDGAKLYRALETSFMTAARPSPPGCFPTLFRWAY
ncbi:MAG: FAD-dependent oxidoreductase, partial [Oceanicaulis sp.]